MKTLLAPCTRLPAQVWNSAPQLQHVPLISPASLLPPGARVVLIAPHPGDEVVMCGGLLQLLDKLGHPVQLLSITDGSASHPGSRRWSAQRLSVFRPQESVEALRRLGLPLHHLQWIRGGFPDSALDEYETELTQFIARYLRPGDVLFSTWRNDGNVDHDAVGRASLLAAAQCQVPVYELAVRAWHWPAGEQARLPWHRARKIRLDTWAAARKSHATHAYASQLQGEPALGIKPSLPRAILERMRQPYEIVFV